MPSKHAKGKLHLNLESVMSNMLLTRHPLRTTLFWVISQQVAIISHQTFQDNLLVPSSDNLLVLSSGFKSLEP